MTDKCNRGSGKASVTFSCVCLLGRKQLEIAEAKGYVKWEVGRDEERKELGLHRGERLLAGFRQEL